MNETPRSDSYVPRYYIWDSLQVLAGTDIARGSQARALAAQREPYFFHDMSSEYDSVHLAEYLKHSSIQLSDEFWAMCETWLRDEQNHYKGVRQIYHMLYDVPIEEIDRQIMAREPDFSPIAHLLEDEFSILLAVAFDEITSARAYSHDRNTYEKLGGEPMLNWVRLAGRDEGVHAGNALSLLKHNHAHRLDEVRERVDRICNYDLTGGATYYGTFLFDHDTDDFSKDLLKKSSRTLCAHFDQEADFDELLIWNERWGAA